jgi:hypothetical protein
VDDASDDDTPALLRAKAREYPDLVFPLRRERGGEGKSHTINHGLRRVRADGWYDAVLAIDPRTARLCWREGVAFPGIVSLLIMLYTVLPADLVADGNELLRALGIHPSAALGARSRCSHTLG